MSSILKALKKLDEEKTFSHHRTLKIDSEILKENTVIRSFRNKGIVLSILFFICGAAWMYVVTLKPTLPQSKPMFTTQCGQIDMHAIHPVNQHDTLPVLPLSQPSTTSGKTDLITIQPRNKKPVTISPDVIPSSPQETVATELQGTPSIMVQGIAYQEENSERVAVVNGVALGQGAIVDGIRVEEIKKDRVRFSQGNKNFEVLLGRGNK